MKFNDTIPGALLFLFSGFVMANARSLPSLPGYAYSAGFFPTITAAALMICSVMLIARGLHSKEKLVVLGDWVKSPKLITNIVLIPLNLVFYMVFANKLGFILTSTIMLIATIWWLRGHIVSTAITSICVSLIAYGFFYKLMMVPLPPGFFSF